MSGDRTLQQQNSEKNYLSKHSFITTRYAVQTKNPQPAMPWRFTEVYWILQKTEIDCTSNSLDREYKTEQNKRLMQQQQIFLLMNVGEPEMLPESSTLISMS
jgi:hypothetical protein